MTTEITMEERPYKPSWIDRFTDWVERLPLWAWVFYVGLGLVLILIQVLFLWLDGGLQFDALLPVIIFNALAIPYLLALIHLLDNQAVTALNSMRVMLDTTEQEFEHYGYRLSNMPVLAPLIAGLILTVAVILTERVSTPLIRYAALEQLPVFAVVYAIIDKSSAFVFGVVIYHTIRQLRLVNSINPNHVRINLFHLGPVRAFSRLTASTATALVAFLYVWVVLNPELVTDPLLFGTVVAFTILAVSIFVWPLYSVHRLLEREKERALEDIDLRFEAVFSKFNQRFREGDYSAIEILNGTISSLEIQHRRVKAIPTWPWKPETVRFLLAALALPPVLRIIQALVERVFGW